MERIETGGSIESADEMTDDYRRHLVQLMLMHADSELAASYGFAPWIIRARDKHAKAAVADMVADETRHARTIYGLLEDLGVDVDDHIREHDYTQRIESPADLATRPAGGDNRVNVLYRPIESWSDLVVFTFLMGRVAHHQLLDAQQCSYGPWARAVRSMARDEVAHVMRANNWMRDLSRDPLRHDELQTAFTAWVPRCLASFGSPNSRRNEDWRRFRLKRRTNEETRRAFHDEVQQQADAWGLTMPAWTPPWNDLDAVAADEVAADHENFGA